VGRARGRDGVFWEGLRPPRPPRRSDPVRFARPTPSRSMMFGVGVLDSGRFGVALGSGSPDQPGGTRVGIGIEGEMAGTRSLSLSKGRSAGSRWGGREVETVSSGRGFAPPDPPGALIGSLVDGSDFVLPVGAAYKPALRRRSTHSSAALPRGHSLRLHRGRRRQPSVHTFRGSACWILVASAWLSARALRISPTGRAVAREGWRDARHSVPEPVEGPFGRDRQGWRDGRHSVRCRLVAVAQAGPLGAPVDRRALNNRPIGPEINGEGPPERIRIRVRSRSRSTRRRRPRS
jgi:hypothetical protein